jgi:hypothetical protein
VNNPAERSRVYYSNKSRSENNQGNENASNRQKVKDSGSNSGCQHLESAVKKSSNYDAETEKCLKINEGQRREQVEDHSRREQVEGHMRREQVEGHSRREQVEGYTRRQEVEGHMKREQVEGHRRGEQGHTISGLSRKRSIENDQMDSTSDVTSNSKFNFSERPPKERSYYYIEETDGSEDVDHDLRNTEKYDNSRNKRSTHVQPFTSTRAPSLYKQLSTMSRSRIHFCERTKRYEWTTPTDHMTDDDGGGHNSNNYSNNRT